MRRAVSQLLHTILRCSMFTDGLARSREPLANASIVRMGRCGPDHDFDLRRNNHTAPPVATITTANHTSQPR